MIANRNALQDRYPFSFQYYQGLDLPEDELKKRLKHCSRHRAKFSPPPSTPPGFWNLSFPDTQEYMAKGYLKTESEAPAPKRLRKTRRNRIAKWSVFSKINDELRSWHEDVTIADCSGYPCGNEENWLVEDDTRHNTNIELYCEQASCIYTRMYCLSIFFLSVYMSRNITRSQWQLTTRKHACSAEKCDWASRHWFKFWIQLLFKVARVS